MADHTSEMPIIDPLPDPLDVRVRDLEVAVAKLVERLDRKKKGPIAPLVEALKERARLAELLRAHARTHEHACDAWYQAAIFVASGGKP